MAFETLKQLSANISEAYVNAKTKANEYIPFAQAKANEAYENAPKTPKEAFFGAKELAAKGLVTLAGITAGVISVIVVSYFLLHALVQKMLLWWLAAVTIGVALNKSRTEENQIDLVGDTFKAANKTKDLVYSGFKMASPIVFSAGNVAGQTLMDLALTGADSVCTSALNRTYETATDAYNAATYDNAYAAASYVATKLYDLAMPVCDVARAVADEAYEGIFTISTPTV